MDTSAHAISDATARPSLWGRAVGVGGGPDVHALRELAGIYWYCAYAWWRRAGLDPDSKAIATMASFERWLGESPPTAGDSGAARMREWMLARLFELAQQGLKSTGQPVMEIDRVWAEERYQEEPEGDPGAIFQRRWALTVIETAATALRDEYSARAEGKLYGEMLGFSGFEQADGDRYSSVAQRLGQTSGAIRKAVFEFRNRQREILCLLVSDTVLDPADADSEITALLCACDATGPETSSAPLPSALQGQRPDEILVRAMRSVKMTRDGSGIWQPPTILEAALLFPNYEITALVGRGGMGAVYKGCQVELDRPVAIKLLPLEVSIDPAFADRFRREARAMAKLNHPNIILIHEFGSTFEGHLFFVMEYVEGADLHQMIHGPGVTAEQSLSIISGVCDALAYAHGKGVVHRDIKPANVMVSVFGEVKVADFGLARLMDPGAEQMGHTMTGTVMGTPDYMAPEQMRGMNVDHRADIYSLGVMLYEMLCGEVPRGIFDPPSTRVSGLCPSIDLVVIKAMQQQPERRYQSTADMKTDVAIAASPKPVVHKAPKPVLAPRTLAPPKPAPKPSPQPAPKPALKSARAKKSSSKKALVITAACLLPLLGFAAWMANRKSNDSVPAVADKTAPVAPTALASSGTPTPAAIPAPSPTTPSWIQPKLPPANADGWITIFDGKVLRGAIISESDMARNAVRHENGSLVINNCSFKVPLPHTDVALRFSGLPKGQNLNVRVRNNEEKKQAYGCWFNAGKNSASALFIDNPTYAVIKHSNKFQDHSNFFDGELRVVGSTQTLLLGGQVIANATDTQITSGKEIKIQADGGRADFKRIEVKILTPERGNTAVANTPPAIPTTGTTSPPLSPTADPATRPKPLQEIDLLALVDPVKDNIDFAGISTTWEKAGGVLVKADDKRGGIASPVALNADAYEIEVGFRRQSVSDAIHINLPISGKGNMELAFGRKDPGVVQIILEAIGTSPALAKALRGTILVKVSTPAQETGKITIYLDGVEIVAWSDDINIRRLSRGKSTREFPDQPMTNIMCNGRHEITSWKLRVLEGEAKVLREPIATNPAQPLPTPSPVTNAQPFVNSLGMKFVPVPITGGPTSAQRVLFSIWVTRIQDYEAFVKETQRTWEKPEFQQGPTHPAVMVTRDDAIAFCEWLTRRERKAGRIGEDVAYRLPTDHEWSCAVGIGKIEDPDLSPVAKSAKIKNVRPWGNNWPPPQGAEISVARNASH